MDDPYNGRVEITGELRQLEDGNFAVGAILLDLDMAEVELKMSGAEVEGLAERMMTGLPGATLRWESMN
jgi:hypothetical protein